MNAPLIYDNRWKGAHGIGRFSQNIQRRLNGPVFEITGENPVSPTGLLNLELQIQRASGICHPEAFFSPGYTPSITWRGPSVFTVHDLIHIDVPEEASLFKTLYYNRVIRPAMARAQRVLTVSEYSRQRLLDWSDVEPEQVVVVGNGVDDAFSPDGRKHDPGYPYLFYVRNTKPHKNVPKLLEAFAQMDVSGLRLILSGLPDEPTRHQALRLGIYERVVFAGRISDEDLPAYYRGAEVVTMPSLYEGFGLPALEGMASGVPVVVSNTTSLPEVVGEAGLLVDPRDAASIADGLMKALTDSELRLSMKHLGLERASLFNWDDVAAKVRRELKLETK